MAGIYGYGFNYNNQNYLRQQNQNAKQNDLAQNDLEQQQELQFNNNAGNTGSTGGTGGNGGTGSTGGNGGTGSTGGNGDDTAQENFERTRNQWLSDAAKKGGNSEIVFSRNLGDPRMFFKVEKIHDPIIDGPGNSDSGWGVGFGWRF